MQNLIIRLFVNAVALWAAARLVPGIELDGSFIHILSVAAIFGLVNALIRPLILLLSLPLIILTLGLFTLVANALMLMLTDLFATSLSIAGFWSALAGSLLISLVSLLFSMVAPGPR